MPVPVAVEDDDDGDRHTDRNIVVNVVHTLVLLVVPFFLKTLLFPCAEWCGVVWFGGGLCYVALRSAPLLSAGLRCVGLFFLFFFPFFSDSCSFVGFCARVRLCVYRSGVTSAGFGHPSLNENV